MARQTEKATVQDYTVLGLTPESSLDQVKKAYRYQVKLWHPDHYQQRPSWERQKAEEKLKQITTAYRRISQGRKSQETKQSEGASPTQPSNGTHRPTSTASRSFVKRHGRPVSSRVKLSACAAFLFIVSFTYVLIARPLPDWFGTSADSKPPPVQLHPSPGKVGTPSVNREATTMSPSDKPGDSTTRPRPEAPSDLPPPFSHRPDSSHFSLGSTETAVLRIQGPPSRVHGQTWVYGLSEVQFKDGRVWRYNNFDGTLKVRFDPPIIPRGEIPPFFTLGSTQNDVLLVQGTPTRVENHSWFYGFSEVRFRGGRVVNYDNYFGNLKIRILPSRSWGSAASRGFFTVGSSKDEVLSVQGTPTSIQGNLWFYQLSNILFRNGKVQYVINSGGNLLFTPPEEISRQQDDSG